MAIVVVHNLQNLQAQAACKGSVKPRQAQQISSHEQGSSHALSSPSLPGKDHEGFQQNLDELMMQMAGLHNEDELRGLQVSIRTLHKIIILQEHIYLNTSNFLFTMHPNNIGQLEKKDVSSRKTSQWNLQEYSANEREEEMNCTQGQSPDLQQDLSQRKDDSSTTYVKKEQSKELSRREDARGEARLQWTLQIKEGQEKKAGEEVWDTVKKMECECCGIEEEYTSGYEGMVRDRLRGHWVCGLCEEAVGEERKRVGGSLQAALEAHMPTLQLPCRRFSCHARSKASPPPSDVAVPRAVCRLLSRHLSTPSPRHHPSSAICLSRSISVRNP